LEGIGEAVGGGVGDQCSESGDRLGEPVRKKNNSYLEWAFVTQAMGSY
jgi:hypothetical protein